MVGTEMQAPASLGTTVVLSFAKYGEDTKLDLKNSSWQQRIFDSDLHDPPDYHQDLGAQHADKPQTKQITVEFDPVPIEPGILENS